MALFILNMWAGFLVEADRGEVVGGACLPRPLQQVGPGVVVAGAGQPGQQVSRDQEITEQFW